MGETENTSAEKHQVFDVSIGMHQQGSSKWFDDDGRQKRAGD
jgi:hypothetical protein